MKQLLILSGKGGTGKTTVASAFIQLSGAKMYADCDVDAPNLHLLLNKNTQPVCSPSYGMPKAQIDCEQCIECNQCMQNCRFGAIGRNENYVVDAYACEGCGVCAAVCPVGAVSMQPNVSGDLMLYKEKDNTVFSTACLRMGSGNSGKLVSEVKKQLLLHKTDSDILILDGSPGIGCPVIASLSGVNIVLIVAEPSVSGISDMKRILKTTAHFGTKVLVCINKCDTNLEITNKIKHFCNAHAIPVIGEIPFDEQVLKAVNQGLTVVDMDCVAGNAVKGIYRETLNYLVQQ